MAEVKRLDPLVIVAQKAKRLEDLKSAGRVGYQLRMPRKALDIAVRAAKNAGETAWSIQDAIRSGVETSHAESVAGLAGCSFSRPR